MYVVFKIGNDFNVYRERTGLIIYDSYFVEYFVVIKNEEIFLYEVTFFKFSY